MCNYMYECPKYRVCSSSIGMYIYTCIYMKNQVCSAQKKEGANPRQLFRALGSHQQVAAQSLPGTNGLKYTVGYHKAKSVIPPLLHKILAYSSFQLDCSKNCAVLASFLCNLCTYTITICYPTTLRTLFIAITIAG